MILIWCWGEGLRSDWVCHFHWLSHKVKHVLHVDKALLYHPVEGTQPVQRAHQLAEIGSKQDKVSNGQGSSRYQPTAVESEAQKASVHGESLEDVEEDEAGRRLPLLRLVINNCLSVTFSLPIFGGEIFDSLCIQETVNTSRSLLIVCSVHLPPVLGPPLSDGNGRDQVGSHGAQDHQTEPDVESHSKVYNGDDDVNYRRQN